MADGTINGLSNHVTITQGSLLVADRRIAVRAIDRLILGILGKGSVELVCFDLTRKYLTEESHGGISSGQSAFLSCRSS